MTPSHRPLAAWLCRAVGAETVRIERLERLGGGAIQENWALGVRVIGGPRAGDAALVLRTSAASGVALSWDRPQEFRILEAARAAGVTVPEPWGLCTDPAVLGKPFYVMARMPGEARGVRLVRDPLVRGRGDALVGRLGCELARLHRLSPPVPGLEFIPVPRTAPALERVEAYRRHLDAMDAAEPVLEWALAWLARNAPASHRVCLVHGDFRTGNYLVEAGELSAILDWEFAAFGDPHEDLGWMLARCWRFGAYDREAGGVGSREAFLGAYEAASGRPLDRAAVPYWEVMATVRWAVAAMMQAERHYSGAEPSLELALTGHRLPTLELDLLVRIDEIEAAG
jgi:aminoglycoside phosphotransferase (APT) family kinase protein